MAGSGEATFFIFSGCFFSAAIFMKNTKIGASAVCVLVVLT